MTRLIALSVALGAATAHAQQIETRTELDAILGDQQYIEDFEGFSLAGGTYVTAPNPLNSITQLSGWGILSGVTYSSPYWLRFYTTFMYGDDSNVLAGSNEVLITFDEPQLAVGFDIVSITGNVTYHDAVTFYHHSIELGSVSRDIAPGGELFVGWQNAASGITSARIVQTGASGWSIIDNVEWGITVASCAPDLNADGTLDFFDVQAFLSAFAAGDLGVDFTNDGVLNFFDVQSFLAQFAAGCP